MLFFLLLHRKLRAIWLVDKYSYTKFIWTWHQIGLCQFLGEGGTEGIVTADFNQIEGERSGAYCDYFIQIGSSCCLMLCHIRHLVVLMLYLYPHCAIVFRVAILNLSRHVVFLDAILNPGLVLIHQPTTPFIWFSVELCNRFMHVIFIRQFCILIIRFIYSSFLY